MRPEGQWHLGATDMSGSVSHLQALPRAIGMDGPAAHVSAVAPVSAPIAANPNGLKLQSIDPYKDRKDLESALLQVMPDHYDE